MASVVVNRDFVCPLSRLASRYVDELVRRGRVVEWRAVQARGPRRPHCRVKALGAAGCIVYHNGRAPSRGCISHISTAPHLGA